MNKRNANPLTRHDAEFEFNAGRTIGFRDSYTTWLEDDEWFEPQSGPTEFEHFADIERYLDRCFIEPQRRHWFTPVVALTTAQIVPIEKAYFERIRLVVNHPSVGYVDGLERVESIIRDWRNAA